MNRPVKFERPPLAEVVFGAVFDTPEPLRAAHIGLYWQTLRDEYPTAEDCAPVPVFAPFAGAPQSIQLVDVPPLRRTLFRSADDASVVQLQDDRFIFNWKRDPASQSYPGYEVIAPRFERHIENLIAFMRSESIGAPSFRLFELTYVNLITDENGLQEVGENGVLRDCTRDDSAERFLPKPSGYFFASQYLFPDNAGQLEIRANLGQQQGANRRILRVDLCARGVLPDTSASGRNEWFALAHEWITHGFADATSVALQSNSWRRLS